MAKPQLSTKRLAIDKANAKMVAIVGVAAFVSVFCLVASKTLLDQRSYQGRVITKKEKARDQLKSNVKAVEQLSTAYEAFNKSEQNILGGSRNGGGERDGDNPRIVLDALPSKYDFPALTSSLDKLVKKNQLSLSDITGTDDEVSQSANQSAAVPQSQEIPFTLEVGMGQASIKPFMQLFERSIRPIQIQKIELKSENQSDLISTKVTAKTYYQPATSLDIKTEKVK